jgi:hypothetical protein
MSIEANPDAELGDPSTLLPLTADDRQDDLPNRRLHRQCHRADASVVDENSNPRE